MARPIERHDRAFAEDHAQDRLPFGAERHADAELVPCAG